MTPLRLCSHYICIPDSLCANMPDSLRCRYRADLDLSSQIGEVLIVRQKFSYPLVLG